MNSNYKGNMTKTKSLSIAELEDQALSAYRSWHANYQVPLQSAEKGKKLKWTNIRVPNWDCNFYYRIKDPKVRRDAALISRSIFIVGANGVITGDACHSARKFVYRLAEQAARVSGEAREALQRHAEQMQESLKMFPLLLRVALRKRRGSEKLSQKGTKGTKYENGN